MSALGEYDMVSSLKTGFPVFKELQGLLFCDTRYTYTKKGLIFHHKHFLGISGCFLSPWVLEDSILHRCSWSQDRTRCRRVTLIPFNGRQIFLPGCRFWWSLWKSPKNRCWSVIFHFLVPYIWLYSNIFRFIMTGWWCNNHLEKWWSSSILSGWHPIYPYVMENHPNVWNHQPASLRRKGSRHI